MPVEYTTRVLTHGFMGRAKGEIRRGELEEDLNAMGAQGWELSHVFFEVALDKEKDGHLLIYKRKT